MNANLIIIGDEILSGTTIDTNSQFIATELKNIGIKVNKIFTISDQIESIVATLSLAFQNTDLVIATGGLGPTKDDKTKYAFADFFNDEIIFSEEVFANLKTYLDKKGRLDILDKNRSQAEVFKNGKVFVNDYGTAPCLMNTKDSKIAFCLPGVPFEVKPLIKDKIIPYLKTHFSRDVIHTRTISVVGIPESELSANIEKWELGLPGNFALSYLPVGTRIKLKITCFGSDLKFLKPEMNNQISKLLPLIKNHVLATDGDKIEEILKTLLTEKKLSISCAESCTGGEISRLITSVSGSSKYFFGGVCTYKTEMKTQILGVSEQLIKEKTVVSQEVAEAMCQGCQRLFNTDIAVSTTGVAGPNSDDFNSQIGLVYYAVRIKNKKQNFRLFLPQLERIDFIEFVSQKVLQSVVEMLILETS